MLEDPIVIMELMLLSAEPLQPRALGETVLTQVVAYEKALRENLHDEIILSMV